jgi:hypothetical protein
MERGKPTRRDFPWEVADVDRIALDLFTVIRDGPRLTFRHSPRAVAGTALLLAAAGCYFGLPLALSGGLDPPYLSSYPGVTSVALVLLALAVVVVRWPRPQTLDRQRGLFLRGGRPVCRLDEIANILVIEEPSDDTSNYRVLFSRHDGRRLPLTPLLRPMTDRSAAERFAELLADYLGVEVLVSYARPVVTPRSAAEWSGSGTR